MSAKYDSIINRLADAVKSAGAHETTPYDSDAKVMRVDGETAWVHIAGGVDETPVKRTIDCKAGDTVQVRVSGGTAFLVGNQTAPPTDDTTAVKGLNSVSKAIKKVNAIADKASRIAGNTAQYFWHTQEGSDTGVHITEVPQSDFLNDPENGGGNLLARSNGIAVRDGLSELATFSRNGIAFYDEDEVEVMSVVTRNGNASVVVAMDISLDAYETEATRVVNLGRVPEIFSLIRITYTINGGGIRTKSYANVTSVNDVNSDFILTIQPAGTGATINIETDAADTMTLDKIEFEFSSAQATSELNVGSYPDDSYSAILRCGNGGENDASNAFAVDWGGTGKFSGDVVANCGADSLGGLSLSKVMTKIRVYFENTTTRNVTVNMFRVGRLVQLDISIYDEASIASGANVLNTGDIASYGIPKPCEWAEAGVTGFGYYGAHAFGALIFYDNTIHGWRLRVRNASSSATALTSLLRISMTYITEDD